MNFYWRPLYCFDFLNHRSLLCTSPGILVHTRLSIPIWRPLKEEGEAGPKETLPVGTGILQHFCKPKTILKQSFI